MKAQFTLLPKPFSPYGQVTFGSRSLSLRQIQQQAIEVSKQYDTLEAHQAMEASFEQAKQKTLANWNRHGQQGIVLFDIDETTLNLAPLFYLITTGYEPQQGFVIDRDKMSDIYDANPQAFPETKAYIEWLKSQNIPYCFLSARSQKNLSQIQTLLAQNNLLGPQMKGIILRDNDRYPRALQGQFKTDLRDSLKQQYGAIVACIGDQPHDLTGDPKIDVLLPNYFPLAGRIH